MVCLSFDHKYKEKGVPSKAATPPFQSQAALGRCRGYPEQFEKWAAEHENPIGPSHVSAGENRLSGANLDRKGMTVF